MANPPRLTEDTLFLAFTRPAMILGVPVEAMAVNIVLTGFIYLVGGSLFFLLVAPILHFVFRAICKNDHNQFRVLFQWAETKGRARNSRFWGGSSAAPLRVVRRYNIKDFGK